MRLFILAAFLVGLVSCGDFLLEGTPEIFAKWSKFKAMESCFGDNVTRSFILKMKKAHAKCQNTQLPPEVQLENSQSSAKLVRALLDGSAKVEKETIAQLKDALGIQEFAPKTPFAVPYVLPYQFAPNQKGSDDDDLLAESIKKAFFKKMTKRLFKNVDFDADDDDDKNEKVKRQRRDDDDEEDKEEEQAIAAPDIYDLGDRLTSKLADQKAAFAAKLGNYSCILQELKIVDKDNELDLDGVLGELKSSGIEDQWLLDSFEREKKLCFERAKALPEDVVNGCFLGPKWVRIKEFMCCCKESKMKTCMAYDTKTKLEANFGPIDKILEQTGLKEKELLAMAARLVFGTLDFD